LEEYQSGVPQNTSWQASDQTCALDSAPLSFREPSCKVVNFLIKVPQSQLAVCRLEWCCCQWCSTLLTASRQCSCCQVFS
jgi:hypothetical protein